MAPVAVSSPVSSPVSSLSTSASRSSTSAKLNPGQPTTPSSSSSAFSKPCATTMSSSALNGTQKPNGVNGHHSSQPVWSPKEVLDGPKRASFAFDSMEDALAAFKAGEFLVVMDDENRENEGDLIIAASQCSTEKMAWMIKYTRCEHFPLPRWLWSIYSTTVARYLFIFFWFTKCDSGYDNDDDDRRLSLSL